MGVEKIKFVNTCKANIKVVLEAVRFKYIKYIENFYDSLARR